MVRLGERLPGQADCGVDRVNSPAVLPFGGPGDQPLVLPARICRRPPRSRRNRPFPALPVRFWLPTSPTAIQRPFGPRPPHRPGTITTRPFAIGQPKTPGCPETRPFLIGQIKTKVAPARGDSPLVRLKTGASQPRPFLIGQIKNRSCPGTRRFLIGQIKTVVARNEAIRHWST